MFPATRSRCHNAASRAVVGRGFLAVASNGISGATPANSCTEEPDSRKNSNTSCTGERATATALQCYSAAVLQCYDEFGFNKLKGWFYLTRIKFLWEQQSAHVVIRRSWIRIPLRGRISLLLPPLSQSLIKLSLKRSLEEVQHFRFFYKKMLSFAAWNEPSSNILRTNKK